MELSKTIGMVAVVLAVLLAAGYAVGEDGAAGASKQTMQMKVEEREAQRRAALEEQQRRKDAFERACNRQLKSSMDFDLCRTAYKRLEPTRQPRKRDPDNEGPAMRAGPGCPNTRAAPSWAPVPIAATAAPSLPVPGIPTGRREFHCHCRNCCGGPYTLGSEFTPSSRAVNHHSHYVPA